MDEKNNLGIDFIERLSGGNHELFHSNLLAFLAEHEPEFFKYLFECGDYEKAEVGREENNLDLCLYNKEGKKVLILENKMKSIPSLAQLKRYATANKKDVTSDCKYILLTLITPVWEFGENDVKWDIITYKKLIDRMQTYLIQNFAASLSYLLAFIHNYIAYVKQIVGMVNDAKKLFETDKYDCFTLQDYCNYGNNFAQNWEKNLSKKALSQACLQHLLKECGNIDLIYQTLYNHGEAGFEILIPLFPQEHCEENPSDMFFIHMQGTSLNRGFRIYTENGKTYKGNRKSKTQCGLTLRGKFLYEVWQETLERNIPKNINESLKEFGVRLDSYKDTVMHAYVFDKFVMPYLNSTEVNQDSLLKDVLNKMKKEIQTVTKICGF